MIFAEIGNVTLRVGDDVHTHQNSRTWANGNIDIFGDFGNLDTGGGPTEFGTTMILRGQIVADCVVTSNGDADNTGYPVASCAPETLPVPAHETNIWGNSDVDTFQFGDETGVNACGGHGAAAAPRLRSDGYIFLGSKTRVHGNSTTQLDRRTTAKTGSSSGTCSR